MTSGGLSRHSGGMNLRRLIVAVSALFTFAGLAPANAAPLPQAPAATSGIRLIPCDVYPGALCGHLDRAWDPAGTVTGTISVGFAFVPARDTSRPALGTVVPHEGGPGYSTTGSAWWFAEMYGTLLDRRNMLLVDQRGTGRSEPINCPGLEIGTMSIDREAAKCARSLGDHANLYGSALSADDLAAIINALNLGAVDMYGDSYGTFFAQVFAGRHPDKLRSLILDGAYPVFGESAWYPTQGPTLRNALIVTCARSPLCASATSRPIRDLTNLVRILRKKPLTVWAPGGDGARHQVTLTAPGLTAIAFNSTYSTTMFREFTAAVRAALDADAVPLARLYAEFFYTGSWLSNPRAFSAGLDTAVSCHDYVQMYDMSASPARRIRQYQNAISRMEKNRPGIYAPFSISDYNRSGWSAPDLCLRWPISTTNPAGPPRPLAGVYPEVPTLILSGELDSITSAAEGDMVKAQFPNSTHIVVANSTHVVGGAGSTSCGATLVRYVVRHGSRDIPEAIAQCAQNVPAVRAVGRYPITYSKTQLPPGTPDTTRNRLAVTAVNTAADIVDRWFQSAENFGSGLRGGTWTYAGYPKVEFTLDDVRLVSDLPMTGWITWNATNGNLRCALTFPSTSGFRRINATWNTIDSGAQASVTISGASGSFNLELLAP